VSAENFSGGGGKKTARPRNSTNKSLSVLLVAVRGRTGHAPRGSPQGDDAPRAPRKK